MTIQRSQSRLRKARQRGTASVEFASCLPVIVLITFGAIEVSNAVYLKQALTAAAYEAALSGTEQNGTDATARANAQSVLTAYGVKGSTITITPALSTPNLAGTSIVVTITAPVGSNGFIYAFYNTGSNMSATVTMCHL